MAGVRDGGQGGGAKSGQSTGPRDIAGDPQRIGEQHLLPLARLEKPYHSQEFG